MKYVLANYNLNPEWVTEYTDDYLIYNKGDKRQKLEWAKEGSVIDVPDDLGNADHDKLSYLIDNYDNLPDVFLWGKSNLFKYITEEEFDKVKDNKFFTPLLTQHHRTYEDRFGVVNYYANGIYHERNDSWYLGAVPALYVQSWEEWANLFGLPQPAHIPMIPGGNFILTREVVHRYSRDLYAKMRDMLPYTQLPGEAQCAERSYYLLWS